MKDTVFTMRSTPYKFGVGATGGNRRRRCVVGLEARARCHGRRCQSDRTSRARDALIRGKKIEVGVFQDVSVEPTDSSVQAAIEFASSFAPDGYVAIGGGSVMDPQRS